MESQKVYPSRNPSVKRTADDGDDNLFQQIFALLQHISSMRLIEKLTRPSPPAQKALALQKFVESYRDLQRKLLIVKNDLKQRITSEPKQFNKRGKSLSMASVTNQMTDWKKAIRAVETRFYQVSLDLHRYLWTEAQSIIPGLQCSLDSI